MSDKSMPKYSMQVAAQLTGMHPQTLRKYEREGLLEPARSPGDHRLYSDEDLVHLASIGHFVRTEGVNISGVRLLMQVLAEIGRIERSLERGGGGVPAAERSLRSLRALLVPGTQDSEGAPGSAAIGSAS